MRALLRSVSSGGIALPVLALVVSANQDAGYNIATAAGSLAVATRIVLTLNPSNRIKQLVTGTFPAGSQLRLVVKGVIFGPGGDGGTPGVDGTDGGDAIVLSASSGLVLLEIDNGAGYIFGGGGGGRGTNGFGGGAGAGIGNGGVSGGGFENGRDGKQPQWTGAAWKNLTNAGGRGGFNPINVAITGNDGTDWGATGLTGDGAPGKAIELNGGVSPTWISGDDSTHVKGAVS